MKLRLLMAVLSCTVSGAALASGGDAPPSDGIVHGYVVDGTTKKPVAGVTVIATAYPRKGVKTEVSTDADGYFRLNQFPAGELSIQFEKKGYRQVKKEPFSLRQGGTLKLSVEIQTDRLLEDGDIEMEHPALRLIDGIL